VCSRWTGPPARARLTPRGGLSLWTCRSARDDGHGSRSRKDPPRAGRGVFLFTPAYAGPNIISRYAAIPACAGPTFLRVVQRTASCGVLGFGGVLGAISWCHPFSPIGKFVYECMLFT